MSIINHIEEGNDVMLKCGWEYERLEVYEGADPGIILGVYKRDGEGGYRLIAHDSEGRVVHADGVKFADMTYGQREDLKLTPVKRKFKVKIKRIVTETAWVDVEALDADNAEEEAIAYAEENYRDIDWDEYDTPEFETLSTKEA